MDNKSWPTRNKKSTMMRWERLRIAFITQEQASEPPAKTWQKSET